MHALTNLSTTVMMVHVSSLTQGMPFQCYEISPQHFKFEILLADVMANMIVQMVLMSMIVVNFI